MSFDPDLPFNDLPALPPAAEIETKAVMRQAVKSARALAELKGLGSVIPDQSMLVDSLVLQEAKASSEVENVITTNDALYKAMASSSGADAPTTEVLRYRNAIWKGYNRLEDGELLSIPLFEDLVERITGDPRGVRETSGTQLRKVQSGDVIYTPPEGKKHLTRMLKELIKFSDAYPELDPLIKMAMFHYQFEAIHPFYDGNGRTGRLLNILYLVKEDLLELPVLYLSKYMIDHKQDYYRKLRWVTLDQAWEPWILFMLKAVEETAVTTRELILGIRRLLDEALEKAKMGLPVHMYSKELIELLFSHPYTKVKFLVDAGIAARQTASEYLKELEGIGLLRSFKVGRENLYLNVSLYEYLVS
jgi:Fic family protein